MSFSIFLFFGVLTLYLAIRVWIGKRKGNFIGKTRQRSNVREKYHDKAMDAIKGEVYTHHGDHNDPF